MRHLFRVGSGPFEGERFGFDTGVFGPVDGFGDRMTALADAFEA